MRIKGMRVGALLVLAVLAACTEAKPGKQTASNPGAGPPDTSQAPTRPAAPASRPVATQEQRVQVSNTLDMPMRVSAVVTGQTQALGTVAAKEQAKFTVKTPANANIQIMAGDKENKHQVQATLMGADSVLHYVIR